jgi:hypothetical protein
MASSKDLLQEKIERFRSRLYTTAEGFLTNNTGSSGQKAWVELTTAEDPQTHSWALKCTPVHLVYTHSKNEQSSGQRECYVPALLPAQSARWMPATNKIAEAGAPTGAPVRCVIKQLRHGAAIVSEHLYGWLRYAKVPNVFELSGKGWTLVFAYDPARQTITLKSATYSTVLHAMALSSVAAASSPPSAASSAAPRMLASNGVDQDVRALKEAAAMAVYRAREEDGEEEPDEEAEQ